MVIHVEIALLAPLGVSMPPPHFIYELFCHRRANMEGKNDFAKFFLRVYSTPFPHNTPFVLGK